MMWWVWVLGYLGIGLVAWAILCYHDPNDCYPRWMGEYTLWIIAWPLLPLVFATDAIGNLGKWIASKKKHSIRRAP